MKKASSRGDISATLDLADAYSQGLGDHLPLYVFLFLAWVFSSDFSLFFWHVDFFAYG